MSTTTSEELIAKELKRAEILTIFLRTHSSTIGPVLDQENASVKREDETMNDAALDQEYKARILDQASHELTVNSTDFRDAFAERTLFVEERDVWYTTTRGEMFAIQTIVRAQGGVAALSRLGLRGSLATTPEKMVLQGQHLQKRFKLPIVARTRSGTGTVDTSALAQRLDTPLSELELRQDLYLEADQRAAKARKDKNDALIRLQLLNQTIGQETIATFRRAGFQDLAYRLRRQLGRVLKPSSSGTPTTPPTDQGTDTASTTTPPETTDTSPTTAVATPDSTTSQDVASSGTATV